MELAQAYNILNSVCWGDKVDDKLNEAISAVLLARFDMQRAGGNARAKKLPSSKRKAIAKKAAQARWGENGKRGGRPKKKP